MNNEEVQKLIDELPHNKRTGLHFIKWGECKRQMELERAIKSKQTDWGQWHYDKEMITLTYIPERYEVDLERCCTMAEFGDWMLHLSVKLWATPECLGWFCAAVGDLDLYKMHKIKRY